MKITLSTPWLHTLLTYIGFQVKTRRESYRFKKKLPNIRILEVCKNIYMQHTFWSCLIRCINMKWIQQVLLMIQNGHNSIHWWTDGRVDEQGETSIPPFQLRWSGGLIKPELKRDINSANMHFWSKFRIPNFNWLRIMARTSSRWGNFLLLE